MNTNKDKVNKIISELIEELKAKYSDFRGIYLFGSYARGEATEDSDIDLAVIFDREIDWRFEDIIYDKIVDYEIENNIFIDTHIFQYHKFSKNFMPLIKNIRNEGVLYEG